MGVGVYICEYIYICWWCNGYHNGGVGGVMVIVVGK